MVRIWKVFVKRHGMYEDKEYFLSRSDAYCYALRLRDRNASRRGVRYDAIFVSMIEIELSGSRSYPTRIF